MTATVSTADPELGERSPLLTGNGEEPKPLEDIKDHYVKEQVVASIAGVSCTYTTDTPVRRSSVCSIPLYQKNVFRSRFSHAHFVVDYFNSYNVGAFLGFPSRWTPYSVRFRSAGDNFGTVCCYSTTEAYRGGGFGGNERAINVGSRPTGDRKRTLIDTSANNGKVRRQVRRYRYICMIRISYVFVLTPSPTYIYSLQTMEETLETLQSMQGESVDELENQLEESKQILASMNVNLKSELLQNLISVMLAADANGDMLLSDEEIEDLIHQLESIHGVELKEQMLKNIIIDAGRSVAGIMELARHVLCDKDIPEDKNIFALVEEYK
jgi:hypothetical protein